MQIVNAPICAPGCCYICKSTPKGPYVDTQQENPDGWERIYICKDCLKEMGNLFDFLHPREVEKLRGEMEGIKEENRRLRIKNKALSDVDRTVKEVKRELKKVV